MPPQPPPNVVALSSHQQANVEPSPATDRANADRFVAQHGKVVRYVPAEKSWRIWDGHRWKKDQTREVEKLARQTLRSIYGEAAKQTRQEDRATLARWAAQSEQGHRFRYMMEAAQDFLATDITDFDQDPWLLNVANGTIDLRTGILSPANPDNLITKLVPVAYDPSAKAPIWLAHLEKVLPDPDVRAFLMRAAGYSVCGSVTEEAMFFCYGSGKNGKSVTLNTIMHVLGDYAATAAPTLLTTGFGRGVDPSAVAGLKGARFVATIDQQDDGKYLAEAQLKQVVSRDRIKGRFLYGNWFEFEPTHHIWMAGNHRPEVRGTDDGLWRRILMIPFTVTIPENEVDRDLETKLRDEWPGILKCLIDGCLEWQWDGLAAPKGVTNAVQEYRTDMDILGDFLTECTATSPGTFIPNRDFYKHYCKWCEENGHCPLAKQRLTRRLKDRGIRCDHSSNRKSRGVHDLVLRDPNPCSLGIGASPDDDD